MLLAFPLAVALTVLAITMPTRGSGDGSLDPNAAGAAEASTESGGAPARVAVLGGPAVPAFGLADTLVARGYEVVAVGPDENSLGATTEVVYYQRSLRSAAEQLRNLLGVGTIRREQVFSPRSDMTIIIGKDLQST